MKYCKECDGRGRVVVEHLVGGVTANGPWQGYREALAECHECDGSGWVEENDD